jgi:hypothetical protein
MNLCMHIYLCMYMYVYVCTCMYICVRMCTHLVPLDFGQGPSDHGRHFVEVGDLCGL